MPHNAHVNALHLAQALMLVFDTWYDFDTPLSLISFMNKKSDQLVNQINTAVADTVPQSNASPVHSAAPTQRVRSIPPVDKWHPEFSGDMDLTIKSNGEWWHEGGLMTRQKLVDLFSSILWCEQHPETGASEYFLKTPVEKWRIQVQDVPLMVTQVDQLTVNNKTVLQFTTQTGDYVIANAEHPLTLGEYTDENGTVAQRPYIPVRKAGCVLNAFIHRNTFYHLVEMGTLVETNGETFLELTSGDQHFVLRAD